jgi:hypothetical protein
VRSVLGHPVRTAADVERLPRLEPEQVTPVSDAIALLLAELGQTPLIGFAGAPFTLASYLIEGAPRGSVSGSAPASCSVRWSADSASGSVRLDKFGSPVVDLTWSVVGFGSGSARAARRWRR